MQRLGRAIIDGASHFGLVEEDRFQLVHDDIYAGVQPTGEWRPLAEIHLEVPLPTARVINIMGGFVMPDRAGPQLPPMWLPKAANFPSGDGAEIQVPDVLTGPVQIEAELAVVVGRFLRKAEPEECREAFLGWAVFNDITAPEYGEMGFWAVAKSLDGFSSWGPWIRLDLTEERVLAGLAITAEVNGAEVQAGNTARYRYPPSEVVSHISHRISLFPGDVVTLGTPFPPAEVVVGDHAVCRVEEVGELHNVFVADSPLLPPQAASRVGGSDRVAADG